MKWPKYLKKKDRRVLLAIVKGKDTYDSNSGNTVMHELIFDSASSDFSNLKDNCRFKYCVAIKEISKDDKNRISKDDFRYSAHKEKTLEGNVRLINPHLKFENKYFPLAHSDLADFYGVNNDTAYDSLCKKNGLSGYVKGSEKTYGEYGIKKLLFDNSAVPFQLVGREENGDIPTRGEKGEKIRFIDTLQYIDCNP